MSNPLFQVLGGSKQNPQMSNMVNQFRQFQSMFKGDPKQQVQNLLNTGRMSQAQYNQLSAMANDFMQYLK